MMREAIWYAICNMICRKQNNMQYAIYYAGSNIICNMQYNMQEAIKYWAAGVDPMTATSCSQPSDINRHWQAICTLASKLQCCDLLATQFVNVVAAQLWEEERAEWLQLLLVQSHFFLISSDRSSLCYDPVQLFEFSLRSLILWSSMMLYDNLWCSLMFYDVLWCSMMFYDVLWSSMIFYDLLWYSMIFYDVLWSSMMFYDLLWCSMMFYNVLW